MNDEIYGEFASYREYVEFLHDVAVILSVNEIIDDITGRFGDYERSVTVYNHPYL